MSINTIAFLQGKTCPTSSLYLAAVCFQKRRIQWSDSHLLNKCSCLTCSDKDIGEKTQKNITYVLLSWQLVKCPVISLDKKEKKNSPQGIQSIFTVSLYISPILSQTHTNLYTVYPDGSKVYLGPTPDLLNQNLYFNKISR